MAAELWRTTDNGDYMLYVDAEHTETIRGIERYRDWKVASTYTTKGGKIAGLQYKIPHNDYAKALRIEKRINLAQKARYGVFYSG